VELAYDFIDKAVRRKADLFASEMDRMVSAVAWGVGIAFEPKNANKWQRVRPRPGGRKREAGLSGAALDAAVMGIAAAQPSLVKITAREA
jgi:hypothetical protein